MSKKQIPNCSIYAVVGQQACGFKSTVKVAGDCLKAKVEIIQLRNKTADIRGFYNNALLLRRIINRKALFIINDRVDIAKLCSADGVHLGQNDIPIRAARKIIGYLKIIGKSCHTIKEAILAEREGADYISVGPIFKTPTKPKYTPVGLGLLKEVHLKVKIPIVAIGGINKNNATLVRDVGVRRIAVVRAICKARDISKAVRELRKAM